MNRRDSSDARNWRECLGECHKLAQPQYCTSRSHDRSDGRARARAAEPRRRDSGGALAADVPVEGPDGPGSARGDLRRPQTHTHPPIQRLPGSPQRAPATAGGRAPPQPPARFPQPPATLLRPNRGGQVGGPMVRPARRSVAPPKLLWLSARAWPSSALPRAKSGRRIFVHRPGHTVLEFRTVLV